MTGPLRDQLADYLALRRAGLPAVSCLDAFSDGTEVQRPSELEDAVGNSAFRSDTRRVGADLVETSVVSVAWGAAETGAPRDVLG